MQSPTHHTASSARTSPSHIDTAQSARTAWSLLTFIALAVVGCALDLITKEWAFERLGSPLVQQGVPEPPIWIIEGVFGFETNLNEGALFGIGQGQVRAFTVLSIATGVGIVLWVIFARVLRDLHLTISLGLVMGGILGNLYDRLGLHGLTWRGVLRHHEPGQPVYAVRDWLHFKIDAIGFDWPIFNLADSWLVCGAILLVWHAMRHRE
ncbi:MAG: signal peptidase II [Planctomycetota bacterium]